ncbi:MAG: dTDP-4-amino-4,6-dideoxygalactose transaminase [Lentisphaeria bacterium]|nr:dTDP-4-amino-4,6-dideoxygalactose transaminase [Lentisphaeria bacterium]
MSFIPFNKPCIAGQELWNIAQAVQREHLSGDGWFTRQCCEWMEQQFHARKVLLTHSCTAALEMAAILCDIRPGDEFIVPSYTFVSTANAFVLRGGVPVFVDIRPDTLNLDETLLERAITPRTKVIVPVHYAGIACDMTAIMEIARRHHLPVVEDAAQGVGSSWRGQYLGTIGHLGCYSFHETKNFISGEGGALVINDERFLERAEIIREKGTDRSRFFRGMVDKYTWVDIGSSYLPGELTAAFLHAQLMESGKITERRLAIWQHYHENLAPLEQQGLIRRPVVPPGCCHGGHMYYLLTRTPAERAGLIAWLAERQIEAVFHYVPLHQSPMGRQLAPHTPPLPVTEDLHARLLRLPCFCELQPGQIDRVCAAVTDFFARSS